MPTLVSAAGHSAFSLTRITVPGQSGTRAVDSRDAAQQQLPVGVGGLSVLGRAPQRRSQPLMD